MEKLSQEDIYTRYKPVIITDIFDCKHRGVKRYDNILIVFGEEYTPDNKLFPTSEIKSIDYLGGNYLESDWSRIVEYYSRIKADQIYRKAKIEKAILDGVDTITENPRKYFDYYSKLYPHEIDWVYWHEVYLVLTGHDNKWYFPPLWTKDWMKREMRKNKKENDWFFV